MQRPLHQRGSTGCLPHARIRTHRTYIGYFYGKGSGPVWLDNVQCNGSETSIADCPHTGWGRNDCSHHEDVSVSCVPDSTEAVALVGGGNPRVGRLEVFHGTEWGTVCGRGFTDAAARVVCYSLGFGHVGRKVDVNRYGVGDGLIWLNNIDCGGTEQYIGQCLHGGWGAHSCSHHQDVAVSCSPDMSVTPMRLAGGSGSAGRLEVLRDGIWGTVCGRFFTSTAADVVCNAIGMGSGIRIDNRKYTSSRGPIWLDNVRCMGTETDIADCSHRGWGVHDCQHREDVAVSCTRAKLEVRLNGGRDPREGRVEVFHSGRWTSVCEDGFNYAAARVVCNMLGFGHVGRPTANNYGRGPGRFWLQSVHCRGTERNLAECVYNLGNCYPRKEQAVSCLTDGSVALFGSGHPRKGRLEVYHNGIWGTVCNDHFDSAAARSSATLWDSDTSEGRRVLTTMVWGQVRFGWTTCGARGPKETLASVPTENGVSTTAFTVRILLSCAFATRPIGALISKSFSFLSFLPSSSLW